MMWLVPFPVDQSDLGMANGRPVSKAKGFEIKIYRKVEALRDPLTGQQVRISCGGRIAQKQPRNDWHQNGAPIFFRLGGSGRWLWVWC